VRLIVTGASGFIGRNLLVRAPRDWEILATYHEAGDFPAFVEQQRLMNVLPIQCDLTKQGDVVSLCRTAGRVDGALYLAANGDPAASTRDPLRDLRLNTLAMLTFLEYCPVPHLVYLSSGAVYDGLAGTVTPASTLRPHLPYAISKLAAESYVRYYVEKRHTPSSYVNVRFFGAYGPYEPLRKITTRFLTAVRRGDRRFTLRGDGRNLIDFMYVDDAVDALFRLIAAPRDTRITLDLASGNPTAVADVVRAMASAIDCDIAIDLDGVTEEYIEFRSGDTTLKEQFGFEPRVSFDEGFRRLASFTAEHHSAAVRG
jgi:nucleoside-diphosphate-sugar epimerase